MSVQLRRKRSLSSGSRMEVVLLLLGWNPKINLRRGRSWRMFLPVQGRPDWGALRRRRADFCLSYESRGHEMHECHARRKRAVQEDHARFFAWLRKHVDSVSYWTSYRLLYRYSFMIKTVLRVANLLSWASWADQLRFIEWTLSSAQLYLKVTQLSSAQLSFFWSSYYWYFMIILKKKQF